MPSDLCKYINNAYGDSNPFLVFWTVVHPDITVVDDFNAFYPNGRHGLSPVLAAGIYGAPITAQVPPYTLLTPMPFGLDPTVSNATQATSTVIDSCGNRLSYEWVGGMVFAGGGGDPLAPPGEAIRQRRWIDGFEIPGGARPGGSVGAYASLVTRDASRTSEGYGLSIRNKTGTPYLHTVTEFTGGGASAARGSWERFYIRLRSPATGTGGLVIWRVRGGLNSLTGAAIFIRGSVIELYNISNAGAFTLLSTAAGALSVDVWTRIDVVYNFGSGAADATFRLWRDGVEVITLANAAFGGTGMGSVGFHDSSEMGDASTAANIEIDADDWVCAERPTTFDGFDWFSGSHILQVRPIAYDASHSLNWTGDFRTLIDNPPVRATATVTSTTASARMAALADIARLTARGWMRLGVPAFTVGMYGRNVGSTDGQLGYNAAGAGDVLTTVDQTLAKNWQATIYNPAGLSDPITPIDPLILLHTKSADANQDDTDMLVAQAECLGVFGTGDLVVGGTPPIYTGIHNAPYVSAEGDLNGSGPPVGVVSSFGLTYVGNGLGQDIALPEPAHWLLIRPLTGATGGAHWWSSMTGTHYRVSVLDERVNLIPQVYLDDTGNAFMRVAGADVDNNAAGVTYQVIGVSDLAMRFVLNGTFMRDATLVAGINSLVDPSFFPEAAFLVREQPNTTGTGEGMYYKGIGHIATRLSPLDGAEIANALTFGLGNLLSQQTPLHSGDQSVAFSLFRVTDGGGPPGGPNCNPDDPDGRLIGITSYTGNGAGGTRVIPLDLNNRFPLLAVVVPHNGASYMRDPSHTGSDSQLWTQGGGVITTGIVSGAANSITIGTTLNANGIVYDVFVLVGSQTGSGGWGTNGTFYPVAVGPRCPPCGPPWTCVEPPVPPPPGPGGACAVDFPVDEV